MFNGALPLLVMVSGCDMLSPTAALKFSVLELSVTAGAITCAVTVPEALSEYEAPSFSPGCGARRMFRPFGVSASGSAVSTVTAAAVAGGLNVNDSVQVAPAAMLGVTALVPAGFDASIQQSLCGYPDV